MAEKPLRRSYAIKYVRTYVCMYMYVSTGMHACTGMYVLAEINTVTGLIGRSTKCHSTSKCIQENVFVQGNIQFSPQLSYTQYNFRLISFQVKMKRLTEWWNCFASKISIRLLISIVLKDHLATLSFYWRLTTDLSCLKTVTCFPHMNRVQFKLINFHGFFFTPIWDHFICIYFTEHRSEET